MSNILRSDGSCYLSLSSEHGETAVTAQLHAPSFAHACTELGITPVNTSGPFQKWAYSDDERRRLEQYCSDQAKWRVLTSDGRLDKSVEKYVLQTYVMSDKDLKADITASLLRAASTAE